MTERLVNALLRLYPRAWRDRYGDELRDLIDQFAEHRSAPAMIRLMPGVIVAATLERTRWFTELNRPRIATTAAAFALATAVVAFPTFMLLGGSAETGGIASERAALSAKVRMSQVAAGLELTEHQTSPGTT